jgi:hypothetical protein
MPHYWFVHGEILEVLRIACNIATCTFRGLMDDIDVNHHLPVVSHLHTLSIDYAVDSPGNLFLSLRLPAVREISIGLCGTISWPHTEFLSLASHSSRQLEKLVFQGIANMSSEHVISCLEAIPSLQELRFGESGYWARSPVVNDAVLRKLTYQPGSEGHLPLVPSLHTFRYQGSNIFEDQSLLDMIESRWDRELPKGLRRLRSVFIKLPRDFAPEMMAHAKTWKEEGLDIVLQTSHS